MDTHAEPGEVLLGRYRVERVLGQGGMGIVVAARHVELGQLHAIKFLLPEMLEHQEVVERFLREARAAATLTSDHVVRVSDVGRMDNGAPYMVMEYLDGCDLKALVSREGPLPIDDALTYVLHVCDAISEAHGAGIIHRDLKPANLFLVRRRGRPACVKVLDFGISKHTGPEEVDLTNTNMIARFAAVYVTRADVEIESSGWSSGHLGAGGDSL
jgi:serine/threonine protein kinase